MRNRKNIKPILFSTPMVQAILAGTKKQTRRVVSLPNSIEFPEEVEFTRMQSGYPDGTRAVFGYMDEPNSFSVSGYQIGDVLWVRETWLKIIKDVEFEGRTTEFAYRANQKENEEKFGHIKNGIGKRFIDAWKWKPSIFMPKEAARIFLKVIDVRVEELQDITEADAIAEGIMVKKKYFEQVCEIPISQIANDVDVYHNYITGFYERGCLHPEWSFASLWKKINGIESWDLNPLVWVISFEQIDKPEDF